MSIDPKPSQQRRYGIQGAVGFDPKIADIPLYRAVEAIIKGDLGLGGAGGTLANAPKLPAGFQQSYVFNKSTERSQVMSRLEAQLTEKLQALVGEQAQASNMSIPDFLRKMGISGISETGTGNLTAYKTDNFLKTSFNPILNSTERMVKTAMKMGGAFPVSTGANEHKRVTAYLRPAQAKQAIEMAQRTADAVFTGTDNRSDLEGSYLSAGDRIFAKNKRKAVRNAAGTFDLENQTPATIEEMESRILKQQAEKKQYRLAMGNLQRKGLVDPDPVAPPPVNPEEAMREKILKAYQEKALSKKVYGDLQKEGHIPADDKGDNAKAAAKGMLTGMFKILDVVNIIRGLTSSAVAYLNNIAGVVGGLVKNSAPLGVGRLEATQLMNFGRFKKVYNGGDENVMLNAGKAFAKNAGDILSSGTLNYTPLAFHGYSDLINPIIKMSVDQVQPARIMETVYNRMAQDYFNIEGEGAEQKRSTLFAKQLKALESLPGTAAGYESMILTGDYTGMINKDNAGNMYKVLLGGVSGKKGKDTKGHLVNSAIQGMEGAPEGSKSDIDKLNDILEVLQRIEDALLRTILANMDAIVRLLMDIAGGIVKFAFGEKSPQYRSLIATDVEMGKKGFAQMNYSAAQAKKDAVEILMTKRNKSLTDATNIVETFESIEKSEERFGSFLKGKDEKQLLVDLLMYKKMADKKREYLTQKGDKLFTDSGDLESHGNRDAAEFNEIMQKHTNTNLQWEQVQRIKRKKPTTTELYQEKRDKTRTTGVIGSNKSFLDLLGQSYAANGSSAVGLEGLSNLLTSPLLSIANAGVKTEVASAGGAGYKFDGVLKIEVTKDGKRVSDSYVDLANDAQRVQIVKI
jgi:hypothetical protein